MLFVPKHNTNVGIIFYLITQFRIYLIEFIQLHPTTGVQMWLGYIYTGVVALAGTSTGSVTAFALTPAYNRVKPTTWVIYIKNPAPKLMREDVY
jgi:hypothetical protein